MPDKTEPPRPAEIDESEKYTRIEIDAAGKVNIEAFNFNGEGCRAATERIENRLGGVKSRKPKDGEGGEAHQTIKA
jgi:hypothetical protein